MDFRFSKEAKEGGHGDVDKAIKFIQRIQKIHEVVQDQLEKTRAKYKMRHDKHRMEHHLQVGDQLWQYISKERMKGEGEKLKHIKYGPFKIVEKIGHNAFLLNLPPYMHIYSVVNVENLKLYEPPMIMDPEENAQIPTVDDFSPECFTELQKDTILDKKVRTSKRGDVEYFQVKLKGMNPSKARWMEIRRVRVLYPHFISA